MCAELDIGLVRVLWFYMSEKPSENICVADLQNSSGANTLWFGLAGWFVVVVVVVCVSVYLFALYSLFLFLMKFFFPTRIHPYIHGLYVCVCGRLSFIRGSLPEYG